MKHNEVDQAWFAAMQEGQKWSASGSPDQAEEAFRLATRIRPERMEGWANLGAMLLERGAFQEAVPTLQRARSMAPGVGVLHLNLAHAYYLAEQYAEALASCRQAVALTPSADALNKLGVILRRSGQFAEAEAAFRQALARDAGHPNAVVNIATLLMLMGRFPEAAQALKTAAGKPLPADARNELRQATLLMTEWERLEPVIRETFPLGKLDGITRALEATPPELLVPDPVVTPFLDAVTAEAERVRGSPAQTWPVPEDWPWIEAHFSLHKRDTVESYLSAKARIEADPLSPESNGMSRYAAAVQARRSGNLSGQLSPSPDAVLRYVHWLILRGVNDAKYCPGHFKLQPNMVDGTLSEKRAAPEHVVGTVRHFYRALLPRVTSAEARAMSVYVMMTKAHCFIDGNGRVGRFLINQELEAGGSSPILIPDAMTANLVEALHTIFSTKSIGPFMAEIRIAQNFTRTFLRDLALARGDAIEQVQ